MRWLRRLALPLLGLLVPNDRGLAQAPPGSFIQPQVGAAAGPVAIVFGILEWGGRAFTLVELATSLQAAFGPDAPNATFTINVTPTSISWSLQRSGINDFKNETIRAHGRAQALVPGGATPGGMIGTDIWDYEIRVFEAVGLGDDRLDVRWHVQHIYDPHAEDSGGGDIFRGEYSVFASQGQRVGPDVRVIRATSDNKEHLPLGNGHRDILVHETFNAQVSDEGGDLDDNNDFLGYSHSLLAVHTVPEPRSVGLIALVLPALGMVGWHSRRTA